jgi:hypothetical protein
MNATPEIASKVRAIVVFETSLQPMLTTGLSIETASSSAGGS